MRLTKHHGVGNDFLVLLDLESQHSIDAEIARALCDRYRGIGADGLIHATAGVEPAHLRMTLRNSDGSTAEMSGNGIRCLAQAEAMRQGVERLALDILTDGGLRHVEVAPSDLPRTITASVDMGPAKSRPSDEGSLVDLGNPHLVRFVDDQAGIDLTGMDPDVNVEFVAVGPATDELTMRVVERGAGETQACGTGACAAAWVAHESGLVGDRVVVHMPGGDVEVVLGNTITLVGPATYIATVTV
jgi:diaminopimelate epimerase